ncbi:MFS transporter [Microbispora corallina]|uniref:MFS transporter n=2 Tax=Microbispora corallina TaxID=83302 RepID=A0ABQ4G020_9ACTN|nr:MFS transporter [Microbispora corallina]
MAESAPTGRVVLPEGRAPAGTGVLAAARRARWAVVAIFAGNGFAIASLAVRTPSLKLDIGLSEGGLGLATTLFGVAAVASMQLTGGLAARWGSAWIVRAAAVALPAALAGVGLAGDLPHLFAAMVVLGVVHGVLDVTMNAHAVTVERALGRSILNGCHAAWSLGAVAGSLAGGAAAQAGVSRAAHYLWLAAALVLMALAVGRRLLPPSADRRSGGADAEPAAGTASASDPGTASRRGRPAPVPGGRSARRAGAWRTGWTRRLLVLGGMGAAVLTCEAAVATWSGVFLHDRLGATLGVASLAYIAFTACQTCGRLVGDRMVARHPAPRLVRAGTAVAAAGLALGVAAPWPALAVAGFALMGLGLATPLPVIVGVVGHMGAEGPGAALVMSRFTTMTYSGILLGPAVIGWVAQAAGLTRTLAALVVVLAVVARLAPAAVGRTPVR